MSGSKTKLDGDAAEGQEGLEDETHEPSYDYEELKSKPQVVNVPDAHLELQYPS